MTNLALIGVGKWGRNYLSAVKDIPNCQIKYTRTHEYQDLLEKDDIDGVIIATPASTHFEIASEFLQKGFNLLIEKPLAANSSEAEKLYELWTKTKPKVLVGLTYLYNQNYQKMKLKLPEIGQIKEIVFEGLSSPVRNDVNILWDWGPHVVSLFLDLVQKPVSKINYSGQKDSGNLELEFDSGIKASSYMQWINPEKIRMLKIIGETGELQVDFSLPNPTPPLTIELMEFVDAIRENKPITSGIKLGVEVTDILTEASDSY